jgi:hypothetical protein
MTIFGFRPNLYQNEYTGARHQPHHSPAKRPFICHHSYGGTDKGAAGADDARKLCRSGGVVMASPRVCSFQFCPKGLVPFVPPCHSFPEPLAPVSCFDHLRCSFRFHQSPEARDVSHDCDATRLACDLCYNHPPSYGTCFLPAVHPAVPSYQLLSTRPSGRLG